MGENQILFVLQLYKTFYRTHGRKPNSFCTPNYTEHFTKLMGENQILFVLLFKASSASFKKSGRTMDSKIF